LQGALASLASYGLALRWPGLAIGVYSFGAPRVGNRAFCRDYDRRLKPNTAFRVVNDLDLVARSVRLMGVFSSCSVM
jgi:triacylglycerol lipase